MNDYADLDELRAMPPGLDRIAAAEGCIANHEDAVREARRIRDDGIRAWAAEHGPAETARATGMPLPTVKVINRGR